MLSFTLDTNCILAVDDGRPDSAFIQQLAKAHLLGTADVAIVAITASERQKNHSFIENFSEFSKRLTNIGLAHLRLVLPMLYLDVTFWDYSLWSGPDEVALEERIHKILFSDLPFSYQQFCSERGLNSSLTPREQGSAARRWINAKCDVQMMWRHVHHRRDIFVTADGNFHTATKKSALVAIGANRIESPAGAALLL